MFLRLLPFVVAAALSALPTTSGASMNQTFIALQQSFSKSVDSAAESILFDVFNSLTLSFSLQPLQISGGVCESAPSDATSFVTDMTAVLIDTTVRWRRVDPARPQRAFFANIAGTQTIRTPQLLPFRVAAPHALCRFLCTLPAGSHERSRKWS
jgi:hypothetical protein